MLIEASAGLCEERDISHSSVERVALPELFTLVEFVPNDMAAVVRDLIVKSTDIPEHTSASDLEHLVIQGVPYNDAYRSIRDREETGDAEWYPTVRTARLYEWETEPRLWEFVEAACRA